MNAIAALFRGLLRFAAIGVLLVIAIVGIFVAWWLVILAVLALSGYFAVRRFFGAGPPAGVPPGPQGAVIIEGEYEVEREDGSRAAGRVIEGVIEVRPPEAGGDDNNRPK